MTNHNGPKHGLNIEFTRTRYDLMMGALEEATDTTYLNCKYPMDDEDAESQIYRYGQLWYLRGYLKGTWDA